MKKIKHKLPVAWMTEIPKNNKNKQIQKLFKKIFPTSTVITAKNIIKKNDNLLKPKMTMNKNQHKFQTASLDQIPNKTKNKKHLMRNKIKQKYPARIVMKTIN